MHKRRNFVLIALRRLVNRAAQFLGGFLLQTPSLSLTQTVTPYQFLGPYGIVLPHPESFEVGHFKANIEIKRPTSKLLGRGKTMLLVWSHGLGETE